MCKLYPLFSWISTPNLPINLLLTLRVTPVFSYSLFLPKISALNICPTDLLCLPPKLNHNQTLNTTHPVYLLALGLKACTRSKPSWSAPTCSISLELLLPSACSPFLPTLSWILLKKRKCHTPSCYSWRKDRLVNFSACSLLLPTALSFCMHHHLGDINI